MAGCDPICFSSACAGHQRWLAHDAYRSELRDALLVYGCSFLYLYQNFDASRVRWPWTYTLNVARLDSSEQDGSAGFKSTRITQVCAIRHLATAELCVCYPTRPWLRPRRQFRVCDARQVSLSNEQRVFVRSIEVRAVNGTAEIGYEHTPTFQVQRQTDSFHQMGKDNLRLFAIPRCNIHGRSVHSVTSRGVPTIRPVHHPIGQIEVQIDWLGQTIEQHFDVVAVRGGLPLRDF